jgi:hypothetical protein
VGMQSGRQSGGFSQSWVYSYHKSKPPHFLVFIQRNWTLMSAQMPVLGYFWHSCQTREQLGGPSAVTGKQEGLLEGVQRTLRAVKLLCVTGKQEGWPQHWECSVWRVSSYICPSL